MFNLGLVVNSKHVLLATDDTQHREFTRYDPKGKLSLNGNPVKLVVILDGTPSDRAAMLRILDISTVVTKEMILEYANTLNVEVRVITSKTVEIFQFIRDVMTHGSLMGSKTMLWRGAKDQFREAMQKYNPLEGEYNLLKATRDTILHGHAEIITVIAR